MDSLITLDSPVIRSKRNANYSTRSPLIPCPSIPVTIEPQNNPFDAVANAVAKNQQPSDPFDIVLKASISSSNTDPQKFVESGLSNSDVNDDGSVKEKNEESKVKLNDESDLIKIKTNVKEFVTERIISCIKKVLHTSPESNSTKSVQTNYRRSFSAGVVRPAGFVGNHLNTSLPLEGSCYSRTLNRSSSGVLQNSDSSDWDDLELTKMKLRGQAKTLTGVINQPLSISSSEEHFEEGNDDSNENLLNSTPPWGPTLFAEPEEDSIGLPKLKTYRHSFSGISNKPALEEKVVHKYLKRRLSTDCNHETRGEESIQVVECFTPDKVADASSIKEDSEHPISDVNNDIASSSLIKDPEQTISDAKKDVDLKKDKQIVAHLVIDNVRNQSLRPKKKAGHEVLKKGPMKAVVPVQEMTKCISEKLCSPFKKKMQLRCDGIKIENVETEIKPVAASTPTSQSPVSSTTKARLRGRENNKMSPTGRKAVRRSSSVSLVEGSRVSGVIPSGTPIKAKKSPRPSKINRSDVSNKDPARPQSAPDSSKRDQDYKNFKRTALKAIAATPLNKNGTPNTTAKKFTSGKTAKVPAQDKENRVM
ncbi:uncharacterized protein isoform X2 [Rhodnius prolixus]|uniref:uncharacterized protein isoform X2 n=1 Tax=Rhodnius prolixus TaxID=13249 RepID=UPI003D188277